MPLHVSGVTRPSSEGSAQILFGAITCRGCVLTVCRLWWFVSSELYASNSVTDTVHR
jgi:hypothetical protein